jgi:hypothetical protein
MPDNTPYTDLKKAILVLEEEKKIKLELLREQVKTTYENLNPINVLKNTLSTLTESIEIKRSLFDILISYAAGLISKKVRAKSQTTTSGLKRGAILILDNLYSYIARNPEMARTIGQMIIQFFQKKDKAEESEE